LKIDPFFTENKIVYRTD
jgi:hypothetical protein